MATFRVYRKPGTGFSPQPKTNLIHADRFEYGACLVFYNGPVDFGAERVACFAPGTWSYVRKVRD